jgi:hypothetical protein
MGHIIEIWKFHYPTYGSVSKPCTPVVHIKKYLGFMHVHPTKNGIFIGIDPYPY